MSEAAARRSPPTLDVTSHGATLRAAVAAVARCPDLDARRLDRILKSHPRGGTSLFSRSELIAGFRQLAAAGDAVLAGLDESRFVERLRMRPVRTLSGVTPVTVLTKPYPCPGECIFCPNDVHMPKSYLAAEPGAQRAEASNFDPYLQTWNRLDALRSIGHPTEKVELIILGGTWSFHPEPYQVWFVRRCFEALNDFGHGIDARREAAADPVAYREALPVEGRRADPRAYNRRVRDVLSRAHAGPLLSGSERSDWEALAAAQRANEEAPRRCVGLALETRPDWLDAAEVVRLRRLGATRLQVGIQSLSDRVLASNRRGHGVAETRRALALLRGGGFKIHAHWMPNLLGATPESDAADYARLFRDPDFRPDELKLYPCLLVESAALARWYERGEWQPYDDGTLLDLLVGCLAATPHWCRLTRIVRDFSSDDIVAGTRRANLREVAERTLRERGGHSRDIRSREIRGARFDPARLRRLETAYATSIGEERFLEWVTPEGRLVGFARLSLPRETAPVAELERSALLREVHVYGASLELGRRAERGAQHRGLGRRLVERAAELARGAGYADLAVISGVGTRAWYRTLGFADGPLYQHLALA